MSFMSTTGLSERDLKCEHKKMERIYEQYYKVCRALTEIIENLDEDNTSDVKRLIIFLEWLTRKCAFFEEERLSLNIPDSVIPRHVTAFQYGKNSSETKRIIDRYYVPSPDGKGYVLKESPCFDPNDKEHLLRKLVLVRGNVVWIEFGFNVGCEFGGKHPAVILKNLGEALIVVPLSSGKPSSSRRYEIEIDLVYGLPKRDRYVNITRLTPVSVYRIDLTSPVGSIPSAKMKQIFEVLKSEWGFV